MEDSKRERLKAAQQDFADVEKKASVMVGRSNFREVRNPEPTEKIASGIVKWGEHNLYPQEVVGWMQDNPIHGGIINQKVTFMTAGGVDITGPQEIVEVLLPMIPEVALDFKLFNGFAVMFSRNAPDATDWKVSFVDFETIRFTDRDYIFAISDDWSVSSQSPEKTGYKEVGDVSRAGYAKDVLDFILYARVKPKQRKGKGNKVSLCYYPVPEYSGAITSILAGIEHDYFTYAEAVNGYKGGTVISLNNGTPDTDAEADKIADDIKTEATDRDKQGGIVVLFADGKERAATIENLNGNDLDKRYVESNKEIRTKIMTGHSVLSPTLFGIASEAMFGSKDEMETAYALYSNNQVVKDQAFIAESLAWAFKQLGIDLHLKFKKYTLTLQQEASDDGVVLRQLNSMSPLVANKVLDSMTPDEIRALAKLLPKTGETPSAEVQAAFAVHIMRYKLSVEGVKNSRAVREAMSSTGPQSEVAAALANIFLLHRLSSCGVERSAYTVLKSRTFDYKASDADFMKEYATFADGLTKIQTRILKLISEGKTFNEVSKATGKGALGLAIEIVKLQAGGHLKGWEVQDNAKTKTEVRYSYEVKAGLGAAIIPTSRDFCRELINLDRLYTRAEIDMLSDEMDLDVWRYRGGWYHNPDTGRTTPSCRHEWKQNIVTI